MSRDYEDLGSVPDAVEVLTGWSEYVSSFMQRRSMVTASLFPEKSAQLSFGYEFCAKVLPAVTIEIASRWSPEDFGVMLRDDGTGQGLRLASALWTGSLGMLSRTLREQGDVTMAPHVVNFWSRSLAAHLGDSRFAWRAGTPLREKYLVWPESRLGPLTAVLQPGQGSAAVKLAGMLANYCWLLECESRQSVFNHGPYDTAGGSLLVKEFLDLRGDAYPWMPEDVLALPRGTVTIAVELDDWNAAFDVLGTVQSEVDLGQMGIREAAILVDGETIDDVDGWMASLLPDLQKAHRALYRTVARWAAHDRFRAGPSTHARIWRSLLASSGATPTKIVDLIDEPLADHVERTFAEWNSKPGLDELWSWVASPSEALVFGPLIRQMSGPGA